MADQPEALSEQQVAAPAYTAPQIDPALLNAQRELDQYRAAFSQLQPHADLIAQITEDPEGAAFAREALSSYKSVRSRTPQIPDEIRPVYEKVTAISDRLDGYDKQLAAQKAAAEAERNAQNNAQLQVEMAYASKLVADHPELTENNYRAIRTIKQYANEDGVSFEQAYKRYGSQFVRGDAESAPPTSLRADAGEIGIPSQSRATGTDGPFNFRNELLSRLKKAK